MSIFGGIALFFLGGSFGVIIMCLLQVSSAADDQYYELEVKRIRSEKNDE